MDAFKRWWKIHSKRQKAIDQSPFVRLIAGSPELIDLVIKFVYPKNETDHCDF